MADKFLDRVYGDVTPETSNEIYDAWAKTYEAEVGENGYATPRRLARALALHMPNPAEPILDFGCGTGLSGLALKEAGLTTFDGMDPSAEMLDRAREKSIYRRLTEIEITDPKPIPHDEYKAITAIGVIGTGAAPASTFDLVLNALPKGGLFGVSLNDHALSEKIYEAAMSRWLDTGAARLLFKKYGPHLPARNIKSNVYILEKA